jgi:uncharacterized FlgJ-related protein
MKFNWFYYSDKEIRFKKINPQYFILLFILIISFGFATYKAGYYMSKDVVIENLSYEDKVIIINEIHEFSEEKLIQEIKNLNLKYPHIVLAQIKLETSNFSSKIFRENWNLFGMKQALIRANTAKGTQYGHAYYSSWRESLLDYALYSCRFLGNVKTEQEYYQYLNQYYAEDPEYINKLKNIINKNKLKTLFQTKKS